MSFALQGKEAQIYTEKQLEGSGISCNVNNCIRLHNFMHAKPNDKVLIGSKMPSTFLCISKYTVSEFTL